MGSSECGRPAHMRDQELQRLRQSLKQPRQVRKQIVCACLDRFSVVDPELDPYLHRGCQHLQMWWSDRGNSIYTLTCTGPCSPAEFLSSAHAQVRLCEIDYLMNVIYRSIGCTSQSQQMHSCSCAHCVAACLRLSI